MNQKRDAPFVEDFEPLLAAEQSLLRQRRIARGLDPDGARTGLALSGGGMRSAAFGLGVTRALHSRGLYDRLDYVSSVGGGGFTGAFVSWLRRRESGLDLERDELLPGQALRFVRQNADYLDPAPAEEPSDDGDGDASRTPTPGTLFGVVLLQMALSLTVYGSLLIGLFLLLHVGDAVVTLLQPALLLASRSEVWDFCVAQLNFAIVAALLVLGVAAVRVLYTVLSHAVRVAWGAAVGARGEPFRGDAWRGLLWLLLGLLASGLTLTALNMASEGAAPVLGALLFGALGVFAFRRCRRSWDAPASGTAPPRPGWLLLPGLGALLATALPLALLGFYLAESGQVPAGDPPVLGRMGGTLACVLGVAFMVALVPHALRAIGRFSASLARQATDPRSSYLRALSFQHSSGTALSWAIAWFVLGSIPWTVQLIARGLGSRDLHVLLLAAALALGTLSMCMRIVRSARPPGAGRDRSILGKPSAVAWAVLLYGVLLLSHGLTSILLDSRFPHAALFIVAFGLALGTLVSLNFAGPGRVYRDRLAEAFLPDARAIQRGRWFPALAASDFPLWKLSEDGDRSPYPLINASLVTSNSASSKYRQRGADSFVLSPLFCGSAATGWVRTQHWLRGRLTLRDAVGISGAAIAPGEGEGHHGGARNRLVAAGLAFFSLRLCYSADNPNPRHCPRRSAIRPNLLVPGLRSLLLGADESETSRHVRLSDGGDFETLGLYELLRRGLELIIVADASDDPQRAFRALGLALERAQEDLGAVVEFEPGAVFGGEAEAPGVAARGFALGTIRYADATTGTLLYLKPALIEDLDVTVQSFAAAHAAFPNEPTTSHAFDTDHFAAYEQLGYQIGLRALDPGLVLSALPGGIAPQRHDSFIQFKGEQPKSASSGE